MKIIAFGWTTPALLAGRKTVTRRTWNADYARRFKPGDIVQAYNRSPRRRGRPVARLRLLSVTQESTGNMPETDYEAEGFAFLHAHGSASELMATSRAAFEEWRSMDELVWVIRFEVIELLVEVQPAERTPFDDSSDAGR